jgi:hypothetical protein
MKGEHVQLLHKAVARANETNLIRGALNTHVREEVIAAIRHANDPVTILSKQDAMTESVVVCVADSGWDIRAW